MVVLENFAIMPQHQSRGLATIFSELILPKCDVIAAEFRSVEVIRMPQSTNEYAALTAGFVKATKRVTARYLKHLTHVTGLAYDAYDKKAQQYAIGSVYRCARYPYNNKSKTQTQNNKTCENCDPMKLELSYTQKTQQRKAGHREGEKSTLTAIHICHRPRIPFGQIRVKTTKV